MGFCPKSIWEKRLMRTSLKVKGASTTSESFLDCLRQFLTPYVWKQAQHAGKRPRASSRWSTQRLIMVLLVTTWCCGDSLPERFETARAFYVACQRRRKQPGKTFAGFQQALEKLPMPILRTLAVGVRQQIPRLFDMRVHGFIPLGADGSRLMCPRSAELESRLGKSNKDDTPPMLWLTALVHLSTGMLWSWRLGKGNASEQHHLIHLLKTLPHLALLVCDAGYLGYDLLRAILQAQASFLIRMSSRAHLYTTDKVKLKRFREKIVYYWPAWAQQQRLPPIEVRLIRIRGKKSDVWLLTNVLDQQRLSHAIAAKFFRWRWRNEGLFRTYKRTIGKVKLMSRTVATVHREAEASLLAVQLLLAQGAWALTRDWGTVVVLASPRQILLEIRREITIHIGLYMGPRQHESYLQRLRRARCEQRQRRSSKIRRKWPGRKDHQPPKPPKIHTLSRVQRTLMAKLLGAA
jgi:hypothetical protein